MGTDEGTRVEPTIFNVVIDYGPPNHEYCTMDLHDHFGGILPSPGDALMTPENRFVKVERRSFSQMVPIRVTYTLICTEIDKDEWRSLNDV